MALFIAKAIFIVFIQDYSHPFICWNEKEIPKFKRVAATRRDFILKQTKFLISPKTFYTFKLDE